jgi:hypothetical protein
METAAAKAAAMETTAAKAATRRSAGRLESDQRRSNQGDNNFPEHRNLHTDCPPTRKTFLDIFGCAVSGCARFFFTKALYELAAPSTPPGSMFGSSGCSYRRHLAGLERRGLFRLRFTPASCGLIVATQPTH